MARQLGVQPNDAKNHFGTFEIISPTYVSTMRRYPYALKDLTILPWLEPRLPGVFRQIQFALDSVAQLDPNTEAIERLHSDHVDVGGAKYHFYLVVH